MKVTDHSPSERELRGDCLDQSIEGSPKANLEKRMKKSHLLRSVAHDLRNPISGILVASEYLIDDLPSASEDHVALLQAIYSSSQFMLRLIDDLL